MKFLTLSKLSTLLGDERTISVLAPILNDQTALIYINEQAKLGILKISHHDMKNRFGLDYSILLMRNDANQCIPIVATAGKKESRLSGTICGIMGGGRDNSKKKLAFGLKDGKAWFLKRVTQDKLGKKEYKNETNTLRILNRLRGSAITIDHQKAYFITDMLYGENLQQYKERLQTKIFSLKGDVKKSKELYSETTRLFKLAAKALQQFHHHGLIHRDIKPSNFMRIRLTKKNYACVLIDFGSTNNNTGYESSSLGTEVYQAPELGSNEQLLFTQSSDLYAFGKSFQEIFTLFSENQLFKIKIIHRNSELKNLFGKIDGILKGLLSDPDTRITCFRQIDLLVIPFYLNSQQDAYVYSLYLLDSMKLEYSDKKKLNQIIIQSIDKIHLVIDAPLNTNLDDLTTILETIASFKLTEHDFSQVQALMQEIKKSFLPQDRENHSEPLRAPTQLSSCEFSSNRLFQHKKEVKANSFEEIYSSPSSYRSALA